MRRSLAAFLIVVVAGTLAFAGVVTLRSTPLAFTLGVRSTGVTASVEPRQEICQGPISTPPGGRFDAVRTQLGTYFRPGPPLVVRVLRQGRTLATGRLAGGYPDVDVQGSHLIKLDHEVDGDGLQVCFRNEGRRKVAFYGAADAAERSSSAALDGKPVGGDIDLVFERPARTYASELGRVLERAALFRAPVLGSAGLLALLVLLAAAATAAVGLAVRSLSSPDGADEPAQLP